MEQENKANTQVNNDGNDTSGTSLGGENQQEIKGRLFTQDEVNSIVATRLARSQTTQQTRVGDLATVQVQRDEAISQLKAYQDRDVLKTMGVDEKYMKYVAFEINNMVTDQLDFAAAAQEFLNQNTEYTNKKSTYRVSMGTSNSMFPSVDDSDSDIRKSMGL